MNLNKNLKVSMVISLLIFLSCDSFAQFSELFSKKNRKNQYSSFGIGGGSSHYFGDLAPYRFFYYGIYTNVRWNATFNYTKVLNSRSSFRASYAFIRLYGNDETYATRSINKLPSNYLRNLNFRNDFNEFALSYIYNFISAYREGMQDRVRFTPYVSVGLGMITSNPKGMTPAVVSSTTQIVEKGHWEPLKDFRTSGQGLPGSSLKQSSNIIGVLPISLGVKFKLTDNLDLNLEGGLRLTTSDNLDDVVYSGYPSTNDLTYLGGISAQGTSMSYRAGESYDPITLQSRADNINLAAAALGKPGIGANETPGQAAERLYPNTNTRGYKKPDSYIVTQITLNYILGNKLKCPKIF